MEEKESMNHFQTQFAHMMNFISEGFQTIQLQIDSMDNQHFIIPQRQDEIFHRQDQIMQEQQRLRQDNERFQ